MSAFNLSRNHSVRELNVHTGESKWVDVFSLLLCAAVYCRLREKVARQSCQPSPFQAFVVTEVKSKAGLKPLKKKKKGDA